MRHLTVLALIVLALPVLTATASLSATPAAYAAVGSATCTGTSVISYTPGLTSTPQTVTYTETDTFHCLSTDPALNPGIFQLTVTLPGASCTAAGLFTSTPYSIDWANGAITTISLSFTDAVINGTEQVTGTGPVTSGEFDHGNATIIWAYPVLNLAACGTPGGLNGQTGSLIAQITTL